MENDVQLTILYTNAVFEKKRRKYHDRLSFSEVDGLHYLSKQISFGSLQTQISARANNS